MWHNTFYDFHSCLYISGKLFNLYTIPNFLMRLQFQTMVHDRHTGLLQYLWYVCKILRPMPIYFHIDIYYICCRTEYVSRGVFQMIREVPNGSLWVSEEEKPLYQVIIPSLQSLRDEWIIYRKISLLRSVLGNEAFQWLLNRWDIETDT